MVIADYGATNFTLRDSYVGFVGTDGRSLIGQGGNGVSLNGSDNYCINNIVEEIGQHVIRTYSFAGEIHNNVVIDSNTVVNSKYYFFDFNGSGGTISGVKVRQNTRYDTPWEQYRAEVGYHPGGGIWTNVVVQDVVFAYNLMYDLQLKMVGFQMNIGACSIYNNTMAWTISNAPIVYVAGGVGSTFKNNILIVLSIILELCLLEVQIIILVILRLQILAGLIFQEEISIYNQQAL